MFLISVMKHMGLMTALSAKAFPKPYAKTLPSDSMSF
jgi:hypothetical protein